MTPVTRENYMFGVPEKGFYKEILNSNAKEFGGSGIGNLGGIRSDDIPRFEFQNSIRVTLPPLAVNVYKFTAEISENKEVTVLLKEINESDTEDKDADQTPGSEISESSNESESVIEKIESETELILSEDDKKSKTDNSENSEMSAEENLKTEAEDIISDQINMEEETNVKPDSEAETVIINPVKKLNLPKMKWR